MAYNPNTHIISAPVSIYDLQRAVPVTLRRTNSNTGQVETVSSNDLGVLCAAVVGDTIPANDGYGSWTVISRIKINMWARFRPVEYNSNDSKDEWNANCIFASDNNMEYGYGLLLDVAGNILSKVSYAGTLAHPEQHLAERVASYWANAKRKIDAELQANKVGDVTPQAFVSVSGEAGTFIPIAISRNWRDDVLKLSLLQL